MKIFNIDQKSTCKWIIGQENCNNIYDADIVYIDSNKIFGRTNEYPSKNFYTHYDLEIIHLIKNCRQDQLIIGINYGQVLLAHLSNCFDNLTTQTQSSIISDPTTCNDRIYQSKLPKKYQYLYLSSNKIDTNSNIGYYISRGILTIYSPKQYPNYFCICADIQNIIQNKESKFIELLNTIIQKKLHEIS